MGKFFKHILNEEKMRLEKLVNRLQEKYGFWCDEGKYILRQMVTEYFKNGVTSTCFKNNQTLLKLVSVGYSCHIVTKSYDVMIYALERNGWPTNLKEDRHNTILRQSCIDTDFIEDMNRFTTEMKYLNDKGLFW